MSDFQQDLKMVAEQVNSYLKDYLQKQSQIVSFMKLWIMDCFLVVK